MEFDRLKINDLSDNGNQPLCVKDCVLVCNGEIFNHEALKESYDFRSVSKSDCEVIIHLYLHLKARSTDTERVLHDLCNMLDGEFAFCLYDKADRSVAIARDPFGVRPLFYDESSMSVASELKAFVRQESVRQFPPGHFAVLSKPLRARAYLTIGRSPYLRGTEEEMLENIRTLFTGAVRKRIMSDRNVCALLSGGLDSSLVAALLAKQISAPLKTFSIGLPGAPDLHYSRVVAEHIGSDHVCVELSKQAFLNAIERVIEAIESYDTTTVRASVGNYLVSEYISKHSDCVVVFNGDYSDEVCGGYKYLKGCEEEEAFHAECCRLVRDICFFDSLRSDRSISAHGLEARVPFADREFVEYYLSIPPSLRMSRARMEKYLLRKAFDNEELLPSSVLWREKEAFSDGVSQPKESWSDIIAQYADQQVSDEEFAECNTKGFALKETYLYHKIFSKRYSNDSVIPYLWMPRFCGEEVVDPSARKL